MNEPRSQPDALDRKLDAALRRQFAVPASLDSLAARTLPRRGVRLRPWMLLAAAASLLASALLWRGLQARPEPSGAPSELVDEFTDELDVELDVELPRVARLPAAEAPFCRLIGPLLDGHPEPGRMQRPDLVRLYQEMDTCQRDASDAACGQGDLLAERMSASYGQPLELRPEAAGLLHGPFGSDEWPTGTIVTGTSDERTAVLVADRGSTLECCVHMEMPADSGLRLFTWQVGDVVLTEITPFEEPRLLGYFE